MYTLKSPFNYAGSKQNTLEFLFNNFDRHVDTFIDLFNGGGCVALTATYHYNNVIMNDILTPLQAFYKILQTKDLTSEILPALEKVSIDKDSQEEYIALRAKYNRETTKDPYMFFSLCSSCTNNLIRLNKKKEFNQTWGRRTINSSTIKKLTAYHNILYNNSKIKITNTEFYNILKEVSMNDFIYLDPPYMQTSAGYNCYWSKELENMLYTSINELDVRGIKFAMSNTLYHKGIKNTHYDKFKHFNIIEVPHFHNKAAKKDKDKQSIEILITNY